MSTTLFVPLKDYIESAWPDELLEAPPLASFDDIWIEPVNIETDPAFTVRTAVLFRAELTVGLPGVDAVKLVFAPSGSNTAFLVEYSSQPIPTLRIVETPIAVRLASTLIRPARRVPSSEPGGADTFELVPNTEFVDITLGTVTLSVDLDGNIGFDGDVRVSLPPIFIGDTGVVVEAPQIDIFLDQNSPPPGKPTGWRGLFIPHAALYLPGELAGTVGNLKLTNAYIGNGGFSGIVSDTWSPALSTELFGAKVTLENVDLRFVQNTLTQSQINGTITLPFFDEPVPVEIGINLDGGVAIKLASDDRLYTLIKDDTLQLELDSLAFEVEDNLFTAKLSGQVTPLFGDLDWPTFYVKELSIDSDGNVHLDGGWLDLREQYSLDFHGFQMEITKLGFGKTEDGGKWIGFSGGLKLVDGFSAGASVEGLRITWYENDKGTIIDKKLTFNGVGVEFEVPEVVRFKGAVAYEAETNEFTGDIKLDLITLDTQVDGKLVVGSRDGQNYFAIYLAAEIPAGIPLWSTGLALYGFAGLFALDMEPDKAANQPWYGLDGETSWYHSDPVGVTELSKWRNVPESMALGAGVTIGTVADNGYSFSGRFLLAFVFPGPVVLLEGKANLLKERAKLDADEPNFRALAVLDNRADTFLFGLDAQYKHDEEGRLIDVRGNVEAFFHFHDHSLWHAYLGQREPRDKWIGVEILNLFEADAYFMLDANEVALGVWVGYEDDWTFGPLYVSVGAWIEAHVAINWKPRHYHSDLALHGTAELSVWRFGTSLTLDADVAADAAKPFHVVADLTVGINLPWPLPDFKETIPFEWGPEPIPPPLVLPLQEIAVEHFKVTTTWPLPRESRLLQPNYDEDTDGFRQQPDVDPDVVNLAEPPGDPPVVPLDGRPHLTFSRPMNDDAMVGVNVSPGVGVWERIGDPQKNEGPVSVRYGLQGIALHQWDHEAEQWSLARRTGSTGPADDAVEVEELFGSWAPVPAMPDGGGEAVAQTKLWIWSKTPFDYTRHAGSAWEEWFTDRFDDYPCPPDPPDRQVCCDFEHLAPEQELRSPWQCPDSPGLILWWLTPAVQKVTVLDEPVEGFTHALCFRRPLVVIQLQEPAKAVKIILVDNEGAEATGFDARGNMHGPVFGGLPDDPQVEIKTDDLTAVVVRGNSRMCILQICLELGPDPDEVTRREEMVQHLRDEMARWSDEGEVLRPNTSYRLKVVTTVEVDGEAELEPTPNPLIQTEFAYFRTEGPPGLTKLSVPIGHPDPDGFDSGLNDLTRYVRQTVPPSVPAPGKPPSLARPVYRAYDVGVEFDQECRYVELMYRLEQRDLGLYLFDNNNRPVRDAEGRLIVLDNRWGNVEQLTLTESELRWITIVNESDCAELDESMIPHQKTLTSASDGQVLTADTVYEARMVPLLLHASLSDLTAWEVVNDGTNAAPSNWQTRAHDTFQGEGASVAGNMVSLNGTPDEPLDLSLLIPGSDVILLDDDLARPSGIYQILSVDEAATTVTVDGEPDLSDPSSAWEIPAFGVITQTANIWGGTVDGKDAVKPGTMLLGGDPFWSDYRLTVLLSSTDDDAIGLVFRYLDAENYYRFSMDRQRRYRRLVRVFDGVHTVLAEDGFIFRQDQDYLITIEAIGSSLRIHQDKAPLFSIVDDSFDRGRIGLYCWANTGARFSDVRVDDFRREAPIVYRFQFTTSQFANFFHHLHSFQDETWHVDLAENEPPPTASELAALLAAATLPAEPASEDEARAYDKLSALGLGSAAHQNPPEVQATRVDHDGQSVALLVQSPEPIDWSRSELEVLHSQRQAPRWQPPAALKLASVTFGTSHPNEESVTLLLREATDLSQHRIEIRRVPGPLAEPLGDSQLLVDEFDRGISGLLFQEQFGPNALDRYTIVDEGTYLGPSAWTVSDRHIVQTSNIYGGSVSGDVPDKPGTMALTGSPTWSDVRVSSTLRWEDDDAGGIVFRYRDAQNYYRFSMDRQRNYRRLVKKVEGTFTVLWEDDAEVELGISYQVVIEAAGDLMLGYLDDALMFSVEDSDIAAGRIGFYCWANRGAHFEALSVEALEATPRLWQPAFADLSEVDFVDAPATVEGPSEWTAEDGTLRQLSNIHVEDDTPHRGGTFALGGTEHWEDVQVTVRLRSDSEGAIGVMFRVSQRLDEDDESEPAADYNYYRFSMDRMGNYRRLVKKANGIVTILWQDVASFVVGQSYNVTIRAEGSELRGYVDGSLLFTVLDEELKRGQVGLYCWSNSGARFEQVLVTNRSRPVGAWRIRDEGTENTPSVWRVEGAALLQTSNIYGGSVDGSVPRKPGTYVVRGESDWSDYRLRVWVRSDDNDAVGLMFRYRDPDNYYRLSLDGQRSYRRLIKKENGIVTTLWQDTGGYVVGEPFTLAIDAIGTRLTGYLNSDRLFQVTDAAHPTGRIGLYCWANDGTRFDRVEVKRPFLESYALLRDRFGDNDTSGWSFVDEGTLDTPSNWIPFEGALRQTSNIYSPPNDRNTLEKRATQAITGDPAWTDVVVQARLQSLDDDAMGLLFRYANETNYYRFSMDSQRQYRRLIKNVEGTFSLLWEDEFAYEIERTYEVTMIAKGNTLRGYLDGVPMFVVEDSDLATGRMGLYCWGNHDARFSDVSVYPADLAFDEWLLDEPFDFLVPQRWTFVDEGDRQGLPRWEVTDGELRQTSNTFGGSTDGSLPDKPGTHALTGDPTWADYRVGVRLRSDDDDAIGVMFRYHDADNYYRFSMDRQRRYRRLIAKVDGAVTVLWEDSVRYTLGREYLLTVDCVGVHMRGYLDGVPIFAVEDRALAAGRIGLYCWGNTGACFSEVRVAAPVWTPYYTFGSERRRSAGTLVELYAGNQAAAEEALPERPGVVRRFIAALDQRGRFRFPTDGVDLRVVAPGSIGGHERRFLPESEYTTVDARVLRNADRTGFFLVVPADVPAGSHLPSGQYRFSMTYRRDNREADPNSQIQSQAGSSDPEHVAIDVPR